MPREGKLSRGRGHSWRRARELPKRLQPPPHAPELNVGENSAQPAGIRAPGVNSGRFGVRARKRVSGIRSSPYPGELGEKRRGRGKAGSASPARAHTRAHRGWGWLSAGECERECAHAAESLCPRLAPCSGHLESPET